MSSQYWIELRWTWAPIRKCCVSRVCSVQPVHPHQGERGLLASPAPR